MRRGCSGRGPPHDRGRAVEGDARKRNGSGGRTSEDDGDADASYLHTSTIYSIVIYSDMVDMLRLDISF
jgi:hypothetical protein